MKSVDMILGFWKRRTFSDPICHPCLFIISPLQLISHSLVEKDATTEL